MALLDRIRKAAQGASERLLRVPYTAQAWQVPPGMNVQSYINMYGNVGWLFGCVSRIASAVSDVDWGLYRVRKSELEELDNHPLIEMISHVNDFQTWNQFVELTSMYIDLVGECFWIINPKRTGQPGEMWIAPPQYMHIVPDAKEFIKGYVYRFGGTQIPFEVKDVIHIQWPNPANIYRGLGPAQSIGVDLESEKFATAWNRNIFYNDATPGTVISYPESIPEDEYNRLKERFGEEHRGYSRAHKFTILSGGATISRVMLSPRDMDFQRLRKVNRDIILGAYGMPQSIMGIAENVNRANAEAANYLFARWVVRPRLTRIREALNEQLCTLYGKDLEFGFDDPVPENRELLLEETKVAVEKGIMTVNEARQALGLDEVKGGDVFLIPITVVPQPVGTIPIMPPVAPKLLEIKKSLFDTEEQKESHWRAYVEKAERHEVKLTDALAQMFVSQREKALDYLGGVDDNDFAKPHAADLFDIEKAKEELIEIVEPILREAAVEAADDGSMLVRPYPEHRSKDYDPVEIYLNTRVPWIADEVNEYTARIVASQLAEGYREGESMRQIAGRIQLTFDHCEKVRARRIARTEIIMASNEGALYGYERSGAVEKVQFYAALDEMVCDWCVGLHGEEFDVKVAHGMIPLHPNCRCCWLPIV